MGPVSDATGARRLLTTFVSLIGAEFMTRGLLLATAVVIVRALSPEGFGDYVYAASAATIAGFVVDLGLSGLVTRDVAADAGRAPSLLSTFLVTQAILGLAIFGIAAAMSIIGVVGGPASQAALVIAFGATAVNALSRPFEAVLVGRARAHLLTVSRTIRGVVLLGGTVVVALLAPSPEAFLGALLGSEVAGTIAVAVLCFARSTRPDWSIRRRELGRLLRLSIPFAISLGLNIAYIRVDILMVGQLSTADATGNYGAATRVLETAIVVPAFFANAFLATISEGDPTSPLARRRTLDALRMIVLICAPLTVALAVAADPLIQLLTGGGYETAADALVRLSPILLLIASYGVLAGLQVALDRVFVMAWINLVGLATKVSLNLYAIPRYGINGAAVTAVIAESLVIAAQWWTARRFFDVGAALVALGRVLAAGTVMLAWVLLGGTFLPWWVTLFVAAPIYLGATVMFKAFSLQEVRLVITALRPGTLGSGP